VKTGTILKIVTVEDSLLVAERVQSMLSDIENIEFLGNARNVSSALQLIRKKQPNVVILDVHLGDDVPNVNGMNLLEAIRRKYPDMKIIMLTNLSGPQYRNTCISLGADFFFDKSNDFDRVVEALKDIQL